MQTVAICTDAVRIEVEHRSGPALTYMLPYKLKRWGKPEVGG